MKFMRINYLANLRPWVVADARHFLPMSPAGLAGREG
jgi:hypothetical protein